MVNNDIKNVKEEILYERTLGYKIKHPFYVLLTKMGVYLKIKKVIKWQGKVDK